MLESVCVCVCVAVGPSCWSLRYRSMKRGRRQNGRGEGGEERAGGATVPAFLCAYKCLALVWVPQAALMRAGGGRGVIKMPLRLQQRRFPSVSSLLPLSTSSVSWRLSQLGAGGQRRSMGRSLAQSEETRS